MTILPTSANDRLKQWRAFLRAFVLFMPGYESTFTLQAYFINHSGLHKACINHACRVTVDGYFISVWATVISASSLRYSPTHQTIGISAVSIELLAGIIVIISHFAIL